MGRYTTGPMTLGALSGMDACRCEGFGDQPFRKPDSRSCRCLSLIRVWSIFIGFGSFISELLRPMLQNGAKLNESMAAPKKVTVDDKDYLLENLNDETKKVVQDCMTINNVINSKRLEIEIASIAQSKKLDELRGLLSDVQCIEEQKDIREN